MFASLYTSFMPGVDDFDALENLQYHFPAGTSIQVASHLSQIRISGRFSFMDYGPEENLNLYGAEDVVEYPLQDIQVPIAIFAAEYDNVVLPENIEWLANQLDTIVEVDWYPYSHTSPTIGLEGLHLNDLLRIIDEYSQ